MSQEKDSIVGRQPLDRGVEPQQEISRFDVSDEIAVGRRFVLLGPASTHPPVAQVVAHGVRRDHAYPRVYACRFADVRDFSKNTGKHLLDDVIPLRVGAEHAPGDSHYDWSEARVDDGRHADGVSAQTLEELGIGKARLNEHSSPWQ